jgi:hypothetical protein
MSESSHESARKITDELKAIESGLAVMYRRKEELLDTLSKFIPWQVGDRFYCIGEDYCDTKADRGRWQVEAVSPYFSRGRVWYHIAARRIGRRDQLVSERRVFTEWHLPHMIRIEPETIERAPGAEGGG